MRSKYFLNWIWGENKMKKHTNVLYREIQRPRNVLWWVFILAETVFMWYWFMKQIIFGIPVGDNPAPDVLTIIAWLVFGIAFPVLMLGVLKLTAEVREDGVYLRYAPFHFRYKQFLFKKIRHYESMTYSPIKRFGGWGVRLNFDGETAYNLSGKEGIKIEMQYETVVIGTQRPEEFKKAMDKAREAD